MDHVNIKSLSFLTNTFCYYIQLLMILLVHG
jgi:hypothetical protein